MSNQIASSVYSTVILDVVNRIRQSGGEIDVETSVLDDLQRTWLQKIILSRVFDFPSQPQEGEGFYDHNTIYENSFDINAAIPTEFAEQTSQQQQQQVHNSLPPQSTQALLDGYENKPSSSYPAENSNVAENYDSKHGPYSIPQPVTLPHDPSTSDAFILQDPPDDNKKRSSDGENDLDDSIDSELDDDGSESEQLKAIKDLVLCQYERVRRTKNKWRCTLRDGIINVDGKDYLFGKMVLIDPTQLKKQGRKRKRETTSTDLLDSNDPKYCRTTLFISGIPYSARNEELLDFFSQFGPVKSCFTVRNGENNENKGYGFVCYSFREDAIKALMNVDNKKFLNNRKLKLEFAIKKNSNELVEKRISSSIKELPSKNEVSDSTKTAKKTTYTLFVSDLFSAECKKSIKFICECLSKFGKLVEIKLEASSKISGVTKITLIGLDQEKLKASPFFSKIFSGKKLTKLLHEFSIEKTQLQGKEEDGSKIIIKNVPFSSELKDLCNLFDDSHKITLIKLPRDDSDKIKGFAFVKFDSPAAAKKFEKDFSKKKPLKLNGRTLRFKIIGTTTVSEHTKNADIHTRKLPNQKNNVSSKTMPESYENDGQIKSRIDNENQLSKPNLFYEGCTLFIKNIPLYATDDTLKSVFSKWGGLRLAKVTINKAYNRPNKSGFVCYYKKADAESCLNDYNKHVTQLLTIGIDLSDSSLVLPELPKTIYESSSPFLINNRPIIVMLALPKDQIKTLEMEKDKHGRNIHLLMEGLVFPDSPAAKFFDKKELEIRNESYNNRKKLIAKYPHLFLSKTRLSVRNMHKSITDIILKKSAIKCVQLFWKDAIENKRQPIAQSILNEEIGNKFMDLNRIPPIKHVKIVTMKNHKPSSGTDTSKKKNVNSSNSSLNLVKSSKSLSKGFGFVEFKYHCDALAFLRYANNNPFAISAHHALPSVPLSKKIPETASLRKPIVEFAIENTKILSRRLNSSKAKTRVPKSENSI